MNNLRFAPARKQEPARPAARSWYERLLDEAVHLFSGVVVLGAFFYGMCVLWSSYPSLNVLGPALVAGGIPGIVLSFLTKGAKDQHVLVQKTVRGVFEVSLITSCIGVTLLCGIVYTWSATVIENGNAKVAAVVLIKVVMLMAVRHLPAEQEEDAMEGRQRPKVIPFPLHVGKDDRFQNMSAVETILFSAAAIASTVLDSIVALAVTFAGSPPSGIFANPGTVLIACGVPGIVFWVTSRPSSDIGVVVASGFFHASVASVSFGVGYLTTSILLAAAAIVGIGGSKIAILLSLAIGFIALVVVSFILINVHDEDRETTFALITLLVNRGRERLRSSRLLERVKDLFT